MNDRAKGSLTRRHLIKSAAAAAAAGSLGAIIPKPLYAATGAPETTKAVLGFIALTDSAPLIVAREKGFYAKHGMPDVEVVKQASWGTTRDNLVLGSAGSGIDGAHILTPMPYLISTGKVTQNNVPTPMYILARLNLDSQCISVGSEYDALKLGLDSRPFKAAIEKKKAAGNSAKAAMTFPGGTHDLWIRYWLAAGGIDPDKDIETIVVPPPQMVANMKVGTMDCFCVGEPWNEQLKNQKIGYTAITTGELWNKHPEKSFAMRADWVDKNPEGDRCAAHGRAGSGHVGRQGREPPGSGRNHGEALMDELPGHRCAGAAQGQVRLRQRQGRRQQPAHHEVLARPRIVSISKPRAVVPHGECQMGQVHGQGRLQDADLEGQPRGSVARGGEGTEGAGGADPATTSRGVEKFFDGKVFDPANPGAYLASLAIKRV